MKSEFVFPFTHFESEKWNENALKSRSRVKSEMKMPRDRDREVKLPMPIIPIYAYTYKFPGVRLPSKLCPRPWLAGNPQSQNCLQGDFFISSDHASEIWTLQTYCIKF